MEKLIEMQIINTDISGYIAFVILGIIGGSIYITHKVKSKEQEEIVYKLFYAYVGIMFCFLGTWAAWPSIKTLIHK